MSIRSNSLKNIFMKNTLLLLFLFLFSSLNAQNFQDTQGKFEISTNGQSTFTLPIATPPSLQDVAPVISLSYSSGQMGGIVGQGWSINSVSAISRVATRIDIDGFIDGVDFDSNDKLALDGQRLLSTAGTNYWDNNALYQTEFLSNTKIQQFGTGTATYFVVTTPDGAQSWYGNYGGVNASDLTNYYIVRFEDKNGSYITYHYNRTSINNSGTSASENLLTIDEIKFSGNTNGLSAINRIKFSYKLAPRNEVSFVKGFKIKKIDLLDKVEVFTNNELFKRYIVSHTTDQQLGYSRVVKLQEFNAAGEPANPVVFDYETTTTQIAGSEIVTNFANNINFSNIELSGDYDGDGFLDFVTDNAVLYHKNFTGLAAPIGLPFVVNNTRTFTVTTLNNNKLNQKNSILKILDLGDGKLKFDVYDLKNNVLSLNYSKDVMTVPHQFTYDQEYTEQYLPTEDVYYVCGGGNNCYNLFTAGEQSPKNFLEGDFNGDGISEIIMQSLDSGSFLQHHGSIYAMNGACSFCNQYGTTEQKSYKIIDLNPNVTSTATLNLGQAADFFEMNDQSPARKIVADFNGDGRSDILFITVGRYKILTINKDNTFEIIGSGLIPEYTHTKQTLLGDYNGDGKTDLMMPATEGGSGHNVWHIFYSNPNPQEGDFFVKESLNITEYWPNSGSYYRTQTQLNNYYALDTNGDGKTDLVRVWRKQYQPNSNLDGDNYDTQWVATTFVNNIGNTQVGTNYFTPDYVSPCQNMPFLNCDHNNGSPELPVPIVSNFRSNGLDNQLLMVRKNNNQLTYVNFSKDVAKDGRITKVTSSDGAIVDEITYQAMEPFKIRDGDIQDLGTFYTSNNSVNYPFVEINKLPTNFLVAKVKNTTERVIKFQDFRYHGFVAHLHGLSSIGFLKTARSAWYQNNTDKRIWNVSENKADLRGALDRSYSQLVADGSNFKFVLSGNPIGIINCNTNFFSTSTATDGLFKIILNKQLATDFITDVNTETAYTYDPLYLLPETIILKNYVSNPTAPDGITTTTNEYENNPAGIGSNYFIGRSKSITTTTAAYADTFSTFEKYTYQHNRIVKTEKRGNTSANKFLVEEFVYNIFGNVIKKTLSATGYLGAENFGPRTTEFTYDSSQRFISTSKNIEGLVSTNVSYHPIYGVVTKTSNPFGLTTETQFDNWGKPIKVTDFLGKSSTIAYTKSTNEYNVTKTSDDTSSSFETSDALGRIKKSGVKNVDGSWSYKNFEYDFLGRKFRESEPYSTGNATQWGTSFFDEYGRLNKSTTATGLTTTVNFNGLTVSATDGIKTTGSTKNANGHVISSIDNGGVIKFSYFANGNVKSSDYNGTVVAMTYNEWAKKISLNDPAAGIYSYTYNALGEALKETTPNGATTYRLDGNGKVLEKNIRGTNTNSNTVFTFDGTTKLLNTAQYTDFDNNSEVTSYNYFYDNFKRLVETNETKPTVTFIRKTAFDAFGRPEKEFYIAKTDTKTSEKITKNTYKNGSHWQIIDDASGAILWQTNTVNQRGQITSAQLGNKISITNTYDDFGFATQFKHDKSATNTNVLTLSTEFEIVRGNLKKRSSSLFNWNEKFEYDTQDRLSEYTNAKGQQIVQTYEIDGRIKENDLGTYGYDSTKKYQNTSIKLTADADPYYKNRVGIFNDSMEQQIGWINYEPAVFSFDTTTIAKSGKTSLKINNTSTTEKVISAETWVKIDNNVPTQYTYSAWVKSNVVGGPQAELFLFMKTETETGYFSQVDQVVSNTGINWVLIEKTVWVPANIKKLSLRLDNNATGIVWFDDVQIRKTSEIVNQNRNLDITYNTFKSPYQISEENVDKISFTYNFAENRSTMFYGNVQNDKNKRKYIKHYSADGSMEVKINNETREIDFVTYIGGDGYTAPIVFKSDGIKSEFLYLHRDYQGSIVAITNQKAVVLEKRLYDAWGNVVKIQDQYGNALTAFAVLDRGYTGHEHLGSVGLIHMNGRLYDSKVHRFLQPDNFIQDIYNTQNYNRYGYVLNNPLKYTDPSGEELTMLGAALVGALVSAVLYTAQVLINDGNFAIGSFFKSAFMGAVSGALANGIGTLTGGITNFWVKAGVQAFLHGTTQGMLAGIQGGDFMQGFAAGALSSIASSFWNGGTTTTTANGVTSKTVHQGISGFLGISDPTAGGLIFGAVAGGAGAALTNGNVWQGAATGFIVAGLNHLAHAMLEPKKTVAGIYGAGGKDASGNPDLRRQVLKEGGQMFSSSFGTNDDEIIAYLKAGFEKGNQLKILAHSRGATAAVRIANKLGAMNISIAQINLYDPVVFYGGGSLNFNYPNVMEGEFN